MTDKKSVFKRIRGAIHQQDAGALAGIFDEYPSADMADVIEHLEPDERLFIFSVPAEQDQEEVAPLFKKHDLVNMPVVDDSGLLLGLIVGWWLSDYALGSIVALAGVLVVINSGFTGSAVPFVLNKCGIDPALATGPLITTLNDILGLVTLFLGSTI